MLLEPAEPPTLVHTPEGFRAAASALAGGRGPFAIDTERASDFRFDDRAFLVQIKRRDAGTWLIAPEGHRAACTDILTPVLNGQDWVLHAAASDLPALGLLGLHPGTLFDTEISGRLLGLPKVNLAALTQDVLGVGLEKQHGNEDWSTWPLPRPWITYAALDVELLLELAEVLAELLDAAGKLSWLEQECAHIASHVSALAPTWIDTKGLGKLRTSEQLQIAKTLWERRWDIGQRRDIAPHKLMSNKVLIELAATLPRTHAEVRKVVGRRASSAVVARIAKLINTARTSPAASWPTPQRRDYNVTPAPRSAWASSFPEAHAALQDIRAELAVLSEQLGTPVENLVQPSHLREIIWAQTVSQKLKTSAELGPFMTELGVRPWQQELASPVISRALF